VVEQGGLENRWAALSSRGFESHPLRHFKIVATHVFLLYNQYCVLRRDGRVAEGTRLESV
jgi:hypothetical protein